jgi:hypothetical protein
MMQCGKLRSWMSTVWDWLLERNKRTTTWAELYRHANLTLDSSGLYSTYHTHLNSSFPYCSQLIHKSHTRQLISPVSQTKTKMWKPMPFRRSFLIAKTVTLLFDRCLYISYLSFCVVLRLDVSIWLFSRVYSVCVGVAERFYYRIVLSSCVD